MSTDQNKSEVSQIVGHGKIVNYLKDSVSASRLTHAYIFVGPKHIGKTTVAKFFIDQVVQRKADQNIHPDIYEIDLETDDKTDKLKKNISIEQVRQLQNKLSLRSFLNSYKAAVINNADRLSAAAANSLLKTLEEPSDKTVIVLLIENLTALPATIVSRCSVIKFLPVSDHEIFDHLRELKVDKKKAKNLTALAKGRPGIALNYLTNQELLLEYLEEIRSFINLIKADTVSRLKAVEKFLAGKQMGDTKAMFQIWLSTLRDVLLIQNGQAGFISYASLENQLTELAQKYQGQEIIEIINQINLSNVYLEANANPKLTLENLVLSF